MTKPVFFNYPAQSDVCVAALQTLGAAGSLTLNTTSTGLGVKGPGANGLVTVPFPGNYRKLRLVSSNNLSGVNFTITGTLAGQLSTEVITGPNATPKTSNNYYDSITSITTDAAATGISIGIDIVGFTAPWLYDTYCPNAAVSVIAAAKGTTGTVTVSFAKGFSNYYPPQGDTNSIVDGIDIPNPGSPNAFQSVLESQVMTHGTIQFAYFNYPLTFAYFSVEAASSFDGSLKFSIIQQGVAP